MHVEYISSGADVAVGPTTPLPAALPAAAWSKADADITRPNNATAYAAGGAIGDASNCVFTFSSFFRQAGATGLLTNARLVINKAAITVPSGIQIRGHIFNATPSSPPAADQADYLSLLANSDAKLGNVDFTNFVTGVTGSSKSDIIESYGTLCTAGPLPLKAAAADTKLFMVLASLGAWTPIASMVFRPYLMAEQN
jgi:hypothetical protein